MRNSARLLTLLVICLAAACAHTSPVGPVGSAEPARPDLLCIASDTVFDPATGLMWQRSAAEGRMSWKAAREYCTGLDLAGYDDWRLPKKRELRTIRTREMHAGCHLFPGVWQGECGWYWSSSRHRSGSFSAWHVSFFSGPVDVVEQTSIHLVRCVRGPLEADERE